MAMPLLAMGQTAPPAPVPFQTIGEVQNFICRVIVGWLFAFLIILAVVFIIYAAFKYLTAGGDPEKVKGAGHSLIYAVVAVAIAIVARSIPIIIQFLFPNTTGISC